MRPIRHLVLLFSLLFAGAAAAAPGAPRWEALPLGDGVEMDLRHFPAEGDYVVLALPCDLGTGGAEARAAQRLAQAGVEVWMADLLGAHFLPATPSNLRGLEGAEVARVIGHVLQQSGGKRLYLVAGGYGAVPALRGARAWRAEGGEPLGGAVFFFPMLYSEEPEPGRKPPYLPVVEHTGLPVMVLQPAHSSGRFWLERLKAHLETGGARVQTRLLPGVAPFFYTSEDPSTEGLALRERLHELVLDSITALENTETEE